MKTLAEAVRGIRAGPLALALAAALSFSCDRPAPAPAEAAEREEPDAITVDVTPVTRGAIVGTYASSATLRPRARATMTARTRGDAVSGRSRSTS